MSFMDVLKEVQLMANQGTPYGQFLAQRSQQEAQAQQRIQQMQQRAQMEQQARQQQGEALANALPQGMSRYADIARATGGDIGAVNNMYQFSQQAPLKQRELAYKEQQQNRLQQQAQLFNQAMFSQPTQQAAIQQPGGVQQPESAPQVNIIDDLKQRRDKYAQAQMFATDPMQMKRAESAVRQVERQLDDIYKEQERNIPGLERVEGARPDATSVRKAQESAGMIGNFSATMDKIIELTDEHGFEVMPSAVKKEIEELETSLLNSQRIIANTGVLNVGEIPVLEKSFGTIKNTAENAYLYKLDKNVLVNRQKQYKSQFISKINNNLKPLGYQYQPPSSTQPSNVQEENQGSVVEFSDLPER